MPDLLLAVLIAAIIALAVILIWRLTLMAGHKGEHARTDDGAERASMAKLRGQPADRFTPGVVLPRTPQLGEPLKPLPTPDVPGPDSSADRAPGYPTKLGGGQEFDSPSGPGALFAEVADEIDQLVDDVKQRFGLSKPEPQPETPAETTTEHYERLFPDNRPEWLRKMEPYPDNKWAVESMFTRAQAEQVRALANGQVDHG